MSTIQHSANDFHRSMKHFSKLVQLSHLLRRANIHKTRGVHVTDLFEWALGTIFARYSFERANPDPRFSTKTVRNCLNDARTNWQRLVLMVAIHLINYVAHFADSRRTQALIIDDSLFKREFSKRTELLSRVFDHDHGCYYKGFRALTLGWSDGNTFMPLNFALMSSSHAKNRISTSRVCDGRTLAARRRAQAQRKMNEVALDLVDDAIQAGTKAKFVLFDSWFTSPKMFAALLKRGLFGVGMLKRSEKVYFRYRKRQMNVKSLYQILRRSKWPAHDNYLYSPIVYFEVNGTSMPVKLVFVTNRANANQYLVLGTTKTNLRPEEIIQLYGRRWQIEGFFKVGKQYLQFDQTQVQNYDGLCGHMAMVMFGYDILALSQREAIDDRTLGDLFYDFGRPLPDIAVAQALQWLMQQLSGLGAQFAGAEQIIDGIFDQFMQTLPSNLAGLLGNAS
ncbi:transposase [Lacticaseibacillus rhamnosus]|uniref:IS4 family transposase n=1 Tax=Lacticaseibacillus rhamnosus TaxID=47715 RepID=UPI00232D428A|nr:transposase [Lacticaseibacillus rhamnosus]MDB7660563.1 transposase [Lacticaseibacillus rhamnosus]